MNNEFGCWCSVGASFLFATNFFKINLCSLYFC
jgi:hypothetical protein